MIRFLSHAGAAESVPSFFEHRFERVSDMLDADGLVLLHEADLKEELGVENGGTRKRILTMLKTAAAHERCRRLMRGVRDITVAVPRQDTPGPGAYYTVDSAGTVIPRQSWL
eukprot:SAG11_NODE_347_length_10420_cov_5.267997_3_plen_112_part_00